MKYQKGFTLIEVMITVAIVAILAGIAVPAYNEHITRSRMQEATSALASFRVQMEQFFQDNRSYPAGCSNAATPPANNLSTPNGTRFTYSCTFTGTFPNATGYTITATGTGAMAGIGYRITETNTRTSVITKSGWSNPSPNNCWAIRKDGSCS